MTMTTTPELLDLEIELLRPAEDNIRTELGDLSDLVASIHAVGIIEPLVVELDDPDAPTFRVLAGHRRLAAAREAGMGTVPCIVRAVSDDAERVEIMLIENLQRAGLNPIEEATGYRQLVDVGLSQREIAERVGCNQSHVSKRLKLLTCPETAWPRIASGDIEISAALQLADLTAIDPDSAQEWLDSTGWPGISERIRRAEIDQRSAAARAEGEASGLPEATGALWEWDSVDRPAATHWRVHPNGMLHWVAERVFDDEATPGEASTSDNPRPTTPTVYSEYEQRRQARAARSDRRNEWIRAIPADQLPQIAADVFMTWMRAEDFYGIDMSPRALEPLGVDIDDTDDQALAWLIVLAGSLHVVDIDADDEDDREVLQAAAMHGYPLDDAERAFLGDERCRQIDVARLMTIIDDSSSEDEEPGPDLVRARLHRVGPDLGGAAVSTCRSCGASIWWAVTHNGERMPVDVEPVDHGNVMIAAGPWRPMNGTLVIVDQGPGLFDEPGQGRYLPHFATCPDADSWRHDR